MSFTVRIRGVEVICSDLDAVAEVINRFGADGPALEGGATGKGAPSSAAHNGHGAPGALDTALLTAFVTAGRSGVATDTVRQMLGSNVRGRAIPSALATWAVRIGIARDATASSVERANPGGQRGWRLNDGALAAARLMGEQR